MKFSLKFPRIPYWYLLTGPWLSVGLGIALNVIVMAANHSQMPVNMPPGLSIGPEDIVHTVMTPATHLKFLADWIYLGDGIASPGDMFIWLGEYTYIPAFWGWLALILKKEN